LADRWLKGGTQMTAKNESKNEQTISVSALKGQKINT
jgi:hypothetical protein